MKDPVPTFTYLVKQIAQRYPSLAYLHVLEPRATGDTDVLEPIGAGEVRLFFAALASCDTHDHRQSNDFIRDIWRPRPLISAGGYTYETALEVAETKGDLIAFGRLFISNVRTKGVVLSTSNR